MHCAGRRELLRYRLPAGILTPERLPQLRAMAQTASAQKASSHKGRPANSELRPIPNKLYFPIREVAELTGVEAYVLRFWEKEFPMLSPVKESSGHRRYRRKDIEVVLEIKRLLYDQGFTIPGARTRLQKSSSGALPLFASADGGKGSKQPGSPSPATQLRQIRRSLNEILSLLDQS
jgi:DNA-binding transcriptional MerR regulator